MEREGDLEAFKAAGLRLVELHPMTIMQNALHSFSGDWSWVPPKAFRKDDCQGIWISPSEIPQAPNSLALIPHESLIGAC